MADQMYLNYELTKFERAAEGQPLAVYPRAGSGCFLPQNFTGSQAVAGCGAKAIPRSPQGRGTDRLRHAAADCYWSKPAAGVRTFWFSGGSTLALHNAEALQYDPNWRSLR